MRTYAAAARATSEIAKHERTWVSPEVAVTVEGDIYERVPHEDVVVAGEELELGTDVAWMLGEAAYNILDDAASSERRRDRRAAAGTGRTDPRTPAERLPAAPAAQPGRARPRMPTRNAVG